MKIHNYSNSIIYELCAILSKKQKMLFLSFVVAALVATGLEIVAVWIMLPLMTTIIDAAPKNFDNVASIINTIFQCKTDVDFIFSATITLIVVYITKGVYNIILLFAKSKYIFKIRKLLSINIFNLLVHLPYSYHLRNNTSKTQNTLITDAERVTGAIGYAINFFSELFTGIGLLILLVIVDIYMTAALFCLFSFIFIINKFFITKKINSTGIIYSNSVMNMLHVIHQAIGEIKILYVTRRQQHVVNNYATHIAAAGRCAERFNLFSGIPPILSENATMAGICIILAALVMHNENLKQILPIAATFAMAATRLLPVCNRVITALSAITYRRASVDTIYNLIVKYGQGRCGASVFEMGYKKPQLSTQQQPPLIDGIILDGISFRFENSTTPLFHKISLTIPANKTTAFIGITGSGKTTLADIILGLHEPYEGTVLVDGRDIFMEKDWWAAKVGYIPQNIYLCDDSILANVAYGFEPKSIDIHQAWACLNDASLREFVESLPQGIDTVIGENGIRLSGGQRQRLGIARALYAKPVFLVMDEATSALDNATEEAIMETIARLSGKITLLIIAHRLTTIKNSDFVYRIEGGQALLENR